MKGKTEFSQDDLCDLLSGAEAQELGGSADGKPGVNVLTKAQICQWVDANSLTLAYRSDAVIAKLDSGPGSTNTDTTVNGVPAVRSDSKNNGGFCQIGIDLTDHSDLVVGASVLSESGTQNDRCAVAEKMATIVFSKVK